MKKLLLFLLISVSAFAYTPSLTSFNTGQVSPLMEARADFQKYHSSCRTIENMLVTAQGPVLKRPGTKYIATAKSGSPRLIEFESSTDDVYVLEFGNKYIRFYRNGGQILDGTTPYEISTDYDSAEIWDIQYTQDDDGIVIVDGNHPPQILTRTDHNDWAIEDVNFTTGPFFDENITDTNITPSDVNGTITLTASDPIFQDTEGASHVGSLWQINQNRKTSQVTGEFYSDGISLSSVYFKGGYSFRTTSPVNWLGTVTLQRSTNNGISWSSALTPLSNTNYDNPAETEEDGAIYRVVMSNYIQGTCKYTLEIADQVNHGIVRITDVNSPTVATAEVLTELEDTNSTNEWREGYWSYYRGWPKTVAFHQQRLVFGGSKSLPQMIWFGKTDPDDYYNFDEGTLDTSAFTIALQGQNPINWLISQDFLLIGTSGSCGKYGEKGESVKPTSPNYQEQTHNGTSSIKGVFADNTILYVERGDRRVREFGYQLQSDKYESDDLNILSYEITESGIKDIAFQTRPDPILWCVLNNGDIATLTYQKGQSVIAWSKQVTDGDFESVAVVSGEDEDEVYVTVNRDGTSYIEQFQPRDWGTDQNDCFFVDSGLSYSGTETATFAGLDHLAGETVSVWADGMTLPNEIVDSSGQVTIDAASSEVTIGLPYTAKLETLPIRIDPQDMAMNKKIKRLWIDFYKTGDCQFSNGVSSDLTSVSFYEGATLSPRFDLYTSDRKLKQFPFMYGGMTKQTMYLESSKPAPMGIRSIVTELELRK